MDGMLAWCLVWMVNISSVCVDVGYFCFFFNDTATTEIYTLSLHDALPICRSLMEAHGGRLWGSATVPHGRSEEHTSELQSLAYLVCRLLLEKKQTHY